MIECPNCGTPMRDDATFCPVCDHADDYDCECATCVLESTWTPAPEPQGAA